MVGSLIRQGARCSLPITSGSLILPISIIQSILDSSLTHGYWYLVPVVLLALNTDEANSIAARPDLETIVPRCPQMPYVSILVPTKTDSPGYEHHWTLPAKHKLNQCYTHPNTSYSHHSSQASYTKHPIVSQQGGPFTTIEIASHITSCLDRTPPQCTYPLHGRPSGHPLLLHLGWNSWLGKCCLGRLPAFRTNCRGLLDWR